MHKIANLLNVQKIVTIHYQALEKKYVSHEEKHDFWEIIYADKEDAIVCIEGERSLLSQGEIIFIAPNLSHYVESDENEPNLFILSFFCKSPSMNYFCDKKIALRAQKLRGVENAVPP